MTTPSLSVSIVSHFSDRPALKETLHSLAISIDIARRGGTLGCARVVLIDNSLSPAEAAALGDLLADPALTLLHTALLVATENKGYGAANNLALADLASNFHLILNPDVVVSPDAISQCIAAMAAHPESVLLTPCATDSTGQRQYIAKAMPAVLTLLARALPGMPSRLRDWLGDARYEMRNALTTAPVTGDFLAGGCFMFCRTPALQAVRGFDESCFMYFEDFDLTRRLGPHGDILYAPSVHIRHGGGRAARKGLRHIFWFGRSAARFMMRYGWRWVS